MPQWILDGEGRPRMGWRIAICLVLFLMTQTTVSIVSVGVVFAVGEARGEEGAALLADAFEGGEGAVLLQTVAALPSLLATFFVVWGCRRFLDRRSLKSLGLTAPAQGWLPTFALGFSAPLLAIGGMVAVLIGTNTLTMSGLSTSGQTWLLLLTLALAAFSEELLARGYLLQNLMEGFGPGAAVTLSSALFWLLHSFNPSAWASPLAPLNLFGAGVVLALVYLASENLWLPTVVHYAWNVTEGLVFQLPVSGIEMDGLIDLERSATAPEWLTGGAFGFEGSILATVAEVGLGLYFYRKWQRRRQVPHDQE